MGMNARFPSYETLTCLPRGSEFAMRAPMNVRLRRRNKGDWPYSSRLLSLWAEQKPCWHAIQHCCLADEVGGIDISR
jgi:hypothetical protein